MKRLVVLASSLFALAGPSVAKECRMPDLKPGVQVYVPPECKDVVRSKPQAEALKSEQGMIDLGNGTKVRIGGRVRAETGWSR